MFKRLFKRDAISPFTKGGSSESRIKPSDKIDYTLLEWYVNRSPQAKRICIGVARDVLSNWFSITDKDGKIIDNLDLLAQSFAEDNNLQQVFQDLISWERTVGWSVIVDWSKFSDLDPPRKFDVFHRNNCQIFYNNSTGAPEYYTVSKKLGNVVRSINVPAEYCYHLATRTMFDNYEGMSALEPIYNDLLYLWHAGLTAHQSYNRYGRGFPVFSYENGVNEEEIISVNKLIDNMDTLTGILLPAGIKFSFEGNNGKDMKVFEYYDIFLRNISTGSSIPRNMLMGVQDGALQAAQVEQDSYVKFIRGEQKLIDRLIKNLFIGSNVLPDSGEWQLTWNDPNVSRKEELEIEKLEEEINNKKVFSENNPFEKKIEDEEDVGNSEADIISE